MLLYHKVGSTPRRFRLLLTSFLQRPGLPFADALPEEAIQKAFDQEGVSFGNDEDAVYTPAITLWAFLSQVLFKEEHRSCVAAVARVAVLLVALKRGGLLQQQRRLLPSTEQAAPEDHSAGDGRSGRRL